MLIYTSHNLEVSLIKTQMNCDEVSVTRQQLIDIVVDLKSEETEKDIQSSITKVFEHTKFGDICLN